jgi:hypothetical protein
MIYIYPIQQALARTDPYSQADVTSFVFSFLVEILLYAGVGAYCLLAQHFPRFSEESGTCLQHREPVSSRALKIKRESSLSPSDGQQVVKGEFFLIVHFFVAFTELEFF